MAPPVTRSRSLGSTSNLGEGEPVQTCSAAALQALANNPTTPTVVKNAIVAALANAGDAPVSLSFLNGLGAAGAAAKKQLLALPAQPAAEAVKAPSTWGAPAAATQAWKTGARQPPAVRTGGLADSILNPLGRGNVSGQSTVLSTLSGLTTGNAQLARAQLDDRGAVVDPNTVMTRATSTSALPAIKAIIASGNPKGAEAVAAELASRYGAFNAQNTPENRKAILDALNWIADTNQGLRYDTPRAGSSDPTTQSPNQTIATRAGVCRDIHSATAAILGSLIDAHRDATGKMVPGSPNGHEGEVQSVGFNNPTEYHDFMVYKDPATGRWNSLEYSKRYDLQAATAGDALRQTTGSLSGLTRYTINGWDGKPIVNSHSAVNAERSNAFFNADAGVGTAGEVRASASADNVQVTGFLTKNVSLSAAVDPSQLGNGLRGGIKLNYHRDFENADTKGYLRVAGGITSDFAESSVHTGLRGANDRATFQTYILGVKVDGRLEGKERELLAQHLKASWGVDLDALGGLPVNSVNGRLSVPVGAVADYSKLNLGAEGGLSGRETLSPNLTLDWAVRARAQVDVLNLGTELVTSEGKSAKRSLGQDPWRGEVAMALTHTADSGLVTRLEAGGTMLVAAPFDSQMQARETHQAVLTVSPKSGQVNFGLVARGETLDHKFIPIDALGVAINVNPSKNVSLGMGATSVFQGGNLRNFGSNVQVTGNVSIRF